MQVTVDAVSSVNDTRLDGIGSNADIVYAGISVRQADVGIVLCNLQWADLLTLSGLQACGAMIFPTSAFLLPVYQS